ncbi:probable ribonuclease P/MRP protein subunit POP5 isoform X4 [Nymphaea colorata]|uniref:probable ribonuclease P/MRP protein subunit POP5 isoform X4 n=1 Tax=Nymphaea colorata TaxID=210225 RepID=UPI00129E7B8A|nr:probable ribonuclease P/MRP protein subunit POP5 isoform X4 [Nymphaea colorata]
MWWWKLFWTKIGTSLEMRRLFSLNLMCRKLKYVNPITKLCIIRVAFKEHQMVWSAITTVKSIGQCPIIFNLLDLSGSLKVGKTVAMKCDEAKFEHYKLTAKDGNSPQLLQEIHNYFEKIKALEM